VTVRPFLDDRAFYSVLRNVMIVGWRDAPLADHIREWHRIGKEVAREHRGTGACFNIVLRGTPRFSDDMRKATEKFAADDDVFELGTAHVILIPGLAGTAVRAFIQTILLVSRSKAPNKVFKSVDESVLWMAPRLAPHGWTSREIQTACDEVVRALG
jgi:hypothetical protein